MRIGIDARFYGSLGKGLGRYVSELLAQLEKLDQNNEYIVFLRNDNFDEYQPKATNFRKVRAEFHWYGWREQILFPLWLKKFRLNLMHFTHFNVPYFYSGPYVVTVHDLILLSHPTPRATTLGPFLYQLKYLFYKLIIRHAVKNAKQIITVSNYSREEILKNFHFLPPGRVSVTYEACGDLPSAENVELPNNIKKPFALYVGSAYPHKNLERLAESFSDFRQRGFEDWSLVLVGGDDYFYNRLKKETKKSNLSENIIFFGRASDQELAALYRQADFYVFPSICEGFGLPPLEAMKAGLPVAAAAASCLPEILEDAADWFSPEDTRDITGSLVRMASDPGLKQRLTEKGAQRVNFFSWTKCAKQTIEIYRQIEAEKVG
jgi:glycosyltransferase involved in cell wall biosynthesis